MAAQEQVFLQEGDVLVTNARIRLHGGKTFATANVTSVSTKIQQYPEPPTPSRQGPGCVMVVGALMGLSGLGSLGSHFGNAAVVLLLGAGVFYAGLMWFNSIKRPDRQPPDYILMIGSASGETEGMRSKGKGEIEAIVKAINDAMIARG